MWNRTTIAAVVLSVAFGLKIAALEILMGQFWLKSLAIRLALYVTTAYVGLAVLSLTRWRRRLAVGIYSATVLIAVAELLHYSYFCIPIHLKATGDVGELLPVLRFVVDMIDYRHFLFLADLPVLFIWYRAGGQPDRAGVQPERAPFRRLATGVVATLLCLVSCRLFGEDFKHLYQVDCGGDAMVIGAHGLPGVAFADVFIVDDTQEVQMLKPAHEAEIPWEQAISNVDRSRLPDIWIFQIESFDSILLDAIVDGEPVVPRFRRLRDRGYFHPHMLSHHLGGRSSDNEFAILNSILPLTTRSVFKLNAYDFPNALTKRLADLGYSSTAFHNNSGDYFSRRPGYGRMGFTEFLDAVDMGRSGVFAACPDDVLMERVQAYSREPGEHPRLTYVISMTSHGPWDYLPSAVAERSLFQSVEPTILRNYFQSMRYVDNVMAAGIEQLIDESNALVIVVGDHCSDIRVPGYRSTVDCQGIKIEPVPLYIFGPGIEASQGRHVVSSLDIYPTILDLLDIDFRAAARSGEPVWDVSGRSVLKFRNASGPVDVQAIEHELKQGLLLDWRD